MLTVLATHVVAMLSVAAAPPQPLTGRVVSVTDGDTIAVLDAANTQHKIRFDAIDAPEKSQDLELKEILFILPQTAHPFSLIEGG